MPAVLTVPQDQLRWYRLAVHHLDRLYPFSGLEEMVGVCGMQNSPPGSWQMAAFVRLQDGTQEKLRQALEERKTLLQAWSYRGVPVVFPTRESSVFLTALAAHPGEEPWIYTRGIQLALDRLEMDWNTALNLVSRAAETLNDRTVQSKEELDRVLAALASEELQGVQRDIWNSPSPYGRPDRQTLGGAVVSFVLRPCAFQGKVVFGVRQGIHPTFTSYIRWLGHPLSPDGEAEKKLVRKFLHAYGPATGAELESWLGCSPEQARRLWQTVAEQVVPVKRAGKVAYLLEEDLPALQQAAPPTRTCLLVGPHDPYLEGRDRELLLADPAKRRQVWRTVGNPPVVLWNGRVVGTWKARTTGKTMEASVTPWESLPPEQQRLLTDQAEAYALFCHKPLRHLVWRSE